MKANLHMEIANKANIIEKALPTELTMEKSTFANNNQNEIQKKSKFIKIRYTIKQGDQKRLNKEGILKVYNLHQVIEIPVTMLLGKWKATHVGITFFKLKEEWQIEGKQVRHITNTQQPFITIAKRLIIKYKLLYLMERLLDRRMNANDLLDNNFFKDA